MVEQMTETKKATIKELRPDDKNINQSSARGGEMLRRSLQEYGAARSLVADKNMRIVAGNQTLEAAAAIGLDDVVVVPTDGSKLVVVQRTDIDLDTPRGRELAIADNRTNQVGYNPDPLMLAWHGSNGADLDKFWLPDELAALDLPDVDGLDLGEEDDEPIGDADAVPEVEDLPTSKRGDLWILGEHRVLCGDSASAEDVARLMNGERAEMTFTDPPYGVNYTGGHFHSGDVNIVRKREKLENDTSEQIYTDVIPVIANFCDGPIYTWFAGTKPLALYEAVNKIGTIHALIIWHKTNATYAAMNAQYKQRHEPCLYWKPKKSTLRWCGASTENTLWEIKRDAANTFHPTQKPVDLAERAISNHTAKSVLDLFLGSGSTLIAAEKTSRKCYGMEISPAYVDVIIKRWQEYTGKEAKHEDGRTFVEVAQTRLANTEES